MEIRREEYEFLVLQHRNNHTISQARRLVGRHCERIEDIVLPFIYFPLGTTKRNI